MATDNGHVSISIPEHIEYDSDKRVEQVRPKPFFIEDLLVHVANFLLLIFRPRKFINYRWANSTRDHVPYGQKLVSSISMLYLRFRPKYMYHQLQRWQNECASFTISEDVSSMMRDQKCSTKPFYKVVCGREFNKNGGTFEEDLTTLSSLRTIAASSKYLYDTLRMSGRLKSVGEDILSFAVDCYRKGYSRAVNVFDDSDWVKLRAELQNRQDFKQTLPNQDENDASVLLVALSYKGRTMRTERHFETPTHEEKKMTEKVTMTDAFSDFRWSQIVCACKRLAMKRNVSKVKIWIDQLIKMNMSEEERQQYDDLRFNTRQLKWPDYGLMAYAVCPVVRCYEENEAEFQTNFWRKIEAVMGIAGEGLIVDDYMTLHYEDDFFSYDHTMYSSLGGGIGMIGGNGKYFRAVTLALATGILSDSISPSLPNEDKQNHSSLPNWKAWALRTIAEGAYSKSHSAMLREEEPFHMNLENFRTIAFWEYFVSTCTQLQGGGYINLNHERSDPYSKQLAKKWDHVSPWVGNCESAYVLDTEERRQVVKYISERVDINSYVATSGHVASLIHLLDRDTRPDRKDQLSDFSEVKHSIVVKLSRFSTSRNGQVIATSDATGIWKRRLGQYRKILPWWYVANPRPDIDQELVIQPDLIEKTGVWKKSIYYKYNDMKLSLLFPSWAKIPLMYIGGLILIVTIIRPYFENDFHETTMNNLRGFGIFILSAVFILSVVLRFLNWPWKDMEYVGEGIYDNLKLHGLLDSQIKRVYRKLESVPYDDIEWM